MAKAQRELTTPKKSPSPVGMPRPPIVQSAEPSEIFECDQYPFLEKQLARATDCRSSLGVLCGVDGSGKTTLLRRFIANLPEATPYASFDESCKTGKQFYQEFLKQLGFEEITGTLSEFRNITREFLIYTVSPAAPSLIFLDNAHLARPCILEQLSWIAATQARGRRILSVVLAGNPELLSILELQPLRSVKFDQRIDVHIRALTEPETDDYVSYCLSAAGAAEVARFSEGAAAMIYRYTGGIPEQIKKLCNAILVEAATQKKRVVNEKTVCSVAEKEQMVPHAVPLENKKRRKTDRPLVSESEPVKRNGRSSAADKNADSQIDVDSLVAELSMEVPNAASALESDIDSAGTTIERLEKQVTDLQASVSKLTTELEGAQEEGGVSRADRKKLKSLEQLLVERDSQIVELETRLSQYTTERTAAQAQPYVHQSGIDEHSAAEGAIISIEAFKDGICEQLIYINQTNSKVMIGRAGDNELRLCSQFVSRHHALILFSAAGVRIEDLNSRNGTIVNGGAITDRMIDFGDKISIGDYALKVGLLEKGKAVDYDKG